jgi:hypothetical protein
MAVNVRKVEIEVAPGKSLKFGYLNSARKEIATGLDVTTDPSSAWTTEQTVRISFGASPCLDVHLEINAYTDAHNLRSRQRAFLYMNGSFVGFVTFDGDQRLRFPVPGNNLRAEANELQIALPDAASPKQLGIGTDERVLGIALVEISFS